MKNTLYYGDNLTIMREHIADESVDLVYLDPPFNSARDYNVLFKQAKKDENQAQITAFTDTWQWSKLQWAVVQVKGGHLTPSMVRDFSHVIERDKAAMGFFICLDTPTKGMYQEAEELGFFDSPSGRKIPKLQVRTIKELLEGKEFDFPKGYSLRSSGKKLLREGEQTELGI